ncbi:MAG: ribokinase [Hungatella sp.]|nr:ribokinase [Hungatella sp.]
MKVLVFGSLNIDYVYKVDHFVLPGETISSRSLKLFCGGKGLNQSIALAKSGADTFHAGAVGLCDSDMLLQGLKEAHVNTDLIVKKDTPSGHAVIQTTPRGENSIILFRGANGMVTGEDVDKALAYFERGDILLLQNEISQLPYLMEQARSKGMKIVLNPSPADEEIFRLPLAFADYLILNEVEGEAIAGAFCGEDRTERQDGGMGENEMISILMKIFPDTRIVLTLGEKGAVYGYRDRICRQPVFPVDVKDTTAAGDTFTGYFVGSVIKGKSVEEALRFASMAAAIAVGREGAGSSIPTLEEVEAYERQRK